MASLVWTLGITYHDCILSVLQCVYVTMSSLESRLPITQYYVVCHIYVNTCYNVKKTSSHADARMTIYIAPEFNDSAFISINHNYYLHRGFM